MRLKRIHQDFRVTEQLDEDALLGDGPFTIYRVTKRGLTTFEAVDLLAKEAGVAREDIAVAGLKDKDGVTGQFMSVNGGRRVDLRERTLSVRAIGRAPRPVESSDSTGNSFEIVVRDLAGDDMRRIRVNLAEVKETGLPNYFDDQRFGCLRHGQGFVVRSLLSGRVEDALRALLAAPSPYGNEQIEGFKAGIQRRWGDWSELASYCRGRRGATVFEHLKNSPEDFLGALERGIATRERTIHLFAWQSYLWNRAAGHLLREIVGVENLGWLPGDAGSLPVFHKLDADQQQKLDAIQLPLLGPDIVLGETAYKAYEAVFRGEGLSFDAFLALDVAGFRPHAEARPLLVRPQFLRAAPAEQDEIYRKRQKMRLRFTLPRGHYATLVCKRLMMPTEGDYVPLRMWVSRHPLDWPDADGTPRREEREDRRHHSERGGPRQTVGEFRASKDERAPWGRDQSGRPERGPGERGKPEHRERSPWDKGKPEHRERSPWDKGEPERRERSPWGKDRAEPSEPSPWGKSKPERAEPSPWDTARRERSSGRDDRPPPRRGKPEGWPDDVPWGSADRQEDPR